MFIYLFFLLLMLLAALVDKKGWISLLCIFGLFLITIFRAESVGLDTINYIRQGLSDYASGLKTQQFIYAFLTSIMAGKPGHLLVVTFAICVFGGIYFVCRKLGLRPALVFFFFILFEYYNQSLNIARQYAAIGILIIAFTYLYEQGKKKYVFFPLVFLAYGLHSSSLACLVLYPLRYINFSKIKVWVMLLFFALVYTAYHLVFKEYYLTLVHTMELAEDIEAYALYFEQAEDAGLSLGGAIIVTLMQLLSVYILLMLRKDESDKARIITGILFVSILLDIFFSELFGNIGRVRFNFNIINIIAYSYYFLKIKDRYKIVVATLVGVIYGYDFVHLLMGTALGTVPYKFDFWLLD